MYAVWCEIFSTNYKVLLKNQCIHYRIESCCICFPYSELDFLDERTDRQEDTESLSSTATSEKSCKHSQSDSVQSETKGKPVANNLTSLPHTIDSLVPVSEEREKELLLKINSYPKAVYHDPVARRFRRKLILRQVRLFQYPLKKSRKERLQEAYRDISRITLCNYVLRHMVRRCILLR